MSKIQLIGPKGLLDETIRLLHTLGIVHIESLPFGVVAEELYIRRVPVEKEKALLKERLERILERLKGIYLLLPAFAQKAGREDIFTGMRLEDIVSDTFLGEVDELEKEVRGLHAERSELLEESSSINRYERILRGISPLVAKLKGLKNFETVGITIEKAKADIVPLLEREIDKISEGKYQFFLKAIDEDLFGIVITYPRQYDTRVKMLISTEAISEIKLPPRYAEMTLFEALGNMTKRREEIPLRIKEIDDALKEISAIWQRRLAGLMEFLRDTIEELKAAAYCGHTRFAFAIFGWIPKDNFEAFSAAVKKMFGDRVMLRELEIRKDEVDLIPVYIKNPAILKHFEVFLKILPPPKYDSIDPTPYLALFFPTFFGLILGDIGYGIILFLLGFYLKKRFKEKEYLASLASVLIISSLFAIVFGALFGEFFGDLGERLGLIHPMIFDRLKAMKVFLILAIGIGIGHITLGLMLAAINYMHRGKPREAAAKVSMLTALAAVVAIMAVLGGYLPKHLLTPGIVIMLAAVIALILFEGVMGPLEVLKTVGNVLSYARIMAVGTASVILALVANKLGGLTGNVILGILIAGIIHAINIFLGILSPTIQSVRLHYVEFFSKFYQPGGRRYEPFKKG